jgi:hypothetical protein
MNLLQMITLLKIGGGAAAAPLTQTATDLFTDANDTLLSAHVMD